MNTPRASLSPRLAGSMAPLRWLTVALASVALAYAGALSWPPAEPWSWVALPTGLALSMALRFGWAELVATLVGLLLAMLGGMHGIASSLGALAAVGATVLIAVRLLRLFMFDARLDRPRDVAALVLVVPLAAAAPCLVLSAWVASAHQDLWWRSGVAGWGILVVGMLLGVSAGLATDRRVLATLQPQADWREGLTALLSVAVVLAGLWALPQLGQALQLLSALALPLLVAGLALRGHHTLGAVAALLGMLIAATALRDMPLDEGQRIEFGAALLVWGAANIAALLGAHAAAVGWAGKAQRWEWALDGSRIGVADWDLTLGSGFASAAWHAITREAARRWKPEAWMAQAHPDDQAALRAAVEAVRSGASGRRQVELRLPDGRDWRWFDATLLVTERDGTDRPTRVLVTLADIHERHQAQERQRMSLTLFQHLHEGLLVIDADMRTLDVNPAFGEILGTTREAMLGRVPSLLRPDPADPQAREQRAAMWAALRSEGRWRGELNDRRADGEPVTLQTTISAVTDASGRPDYHVVVIADITAQRQQREQLERQAHFDELTRLPNRTRLSQLLVEAMQATDRDGYLLIVCYLDIDHFKPVNDRHGHAAGDRLLVELAARLRSALRSRVNWADAAARLGGDEFVLLLRAGTLEEARLAVERVLRVVAQPYVVDPDADPVQVSASMGATIYPIDRSDADTLLRHADNAMYGAKQAGRNGYLFFDPENRRRTEERVMAIGRVQEALDLHEFVLFYQPKVDMRTGRVLGLEALLRWEHPQQGLIAPLQFLPLIENTGLSSRVGDWVLSQALDHLVQWHRAGLGLSVSVNISARHLQEPDFAQRLSALLARRSEPLARHLELEMLESAAHADIEATSQLMARCQAMGVRFALDDFGTGYSTLTYLKRLPVDVLKIDRSFVHHMLVDAHDRAIVEGVVGLARTFNCSVVAEGVESPAQARALLELGCDIGQGNGIATPMRAEEVARWVREYRGMFALAQAAAPAPGTEAQRPASAT
ncbi:MAG: EAL domain-containing protein [Rubrivivax sp.]|nr:EAL domain-containing protein [Rubrivivax sp.]